MKESTLQAVKALEEAREVAKQAQNKRIDAQNALEAAEKAEADACAVVRAAKEAARKELGL